MPKTNCTDWQRSLKPQNCNRQARIEVAGRLVHVQLLRNCFWMKFAAKAHESPKGRGIRGWAIISDLSETLDLFLCLEGTVIGEDDAVFCCVLVPEREHGFGFLRLLFGQIRGFGGISF